MLIRLGINITQIPAQKDPLKGFQIPKVTIRNQIFFEKLGKIGIDFCRKVW
jgi:hypothetical protein